ncbi:hypothetical protein HH308_24140 [Gordonia sp. TBRC 11910]|uniref:Lsr2 DNA-binding domain-containing protein n=1 Tax=Gordonia asplenii TaxID=2725283 RepID=A0A848L061_9ACTN|nr:histone-like nucleoid-structuring protein Lsr2 [Gordonia asplenii]NMO04314.1 hypothetical protein [Gordonia asplenii]
MSYYYIDRLLGDMQAALSEVRKSIDSLNDRVDRLSTDLSEMDGRVTRRMDGLEETVNRGFEWLDNHAHEMNDRLNAIQVWDGEKFQEVHKQPHLHDGWVAWNPADRAPTVSSKRRSWEVRAWAQENGYKISDRGRMPLTVIEAYDAVH